MERTPDCYEKENWDAFSEQLQAALESIPRYEMKIVMGNMNAKVCYDNISYKGPMCKEGCGSMNDKIFH